MTQSISDSVDQLTQSISDSVNPDRRGIAATSSVHQATAVLQLRCLLKAVIASAATGDRQGYMLTCEYNILRVAGGFSTVKLYNRIRGDRIRGVQKVTLNLIYLILFIEYYLACGPRELPMSL